MELVFFWNPEKLWKLGETQADLQDDETDMAQSPLPPKPTACQPLDM